MKYWNYPTTGMGNYAYQQDFWVDDQIETLTFSAQFGNTTYRWSQMPNVMTDSYTTAQAQAVGTLMYHVGVALRMRYGYTSSAFPMSGFVLAAYFGYDPNAVLCFRDDYSDYTWEQIIYDELSAGRPVIYGGSKQGGSGHSFVCDGYRASTDSYHINWGWSGNSDGYFPLSGTNALKPDTSGSGGAGEGAAYTVNQDIWIGIQPANSPTPTLVTSIELNDNAIELAPGQQRQLVATLQPTYPTYGMVTWSSSDTSVATVDAFGMVTAQQHGTATITARAQDGTNLSARCAITVMDNPPLTIGTQNELTSLLPYSAGKTYSSSQTIYTAQEMGGSRIIDALSYYVAGVPDNNAQADIEIWLGTTTLSQFSDPSEAIPASALTRVYSGTSTYGTQLGWEKFQFDQPYLYDGRYNLVVAVTHKSRGYIGGLYHASSYAAEYRSLYRHSDTDASYINVGATTGYQLPFSSDNLVNTKFWFGNSCLMTCGDNTYAQYQISGDLQISGTGPMYEYQSGKMPWQLFKGDIKRIVVSEGVTSLSDYAFSGIKAQTLTLPSTLTQVGSSTFYAMTSLVGLKVASANPVFSDGNGSNLLIDTRTQTTVCAGIYCSQVPDGVVHIGNNSFIFNQFNVIKLPNSVLTIGNDAFYGARMTSIHLPSQLTTIGESAFQNCQLLTSVDIPSQVSSIAPRAFSSCLNLSHLAVDPANTTYDSRNHCNAIIRSADNVLIAGCRTTIIPASVCTIGNVACEFIHAFESLTIPEGVSAIDELAFRSCSSLQTLRLPSTLEQIDSYAFLYCNSLSSIYVGPTPATVEHSAFTNEQYNEGTLYVPIGCKQAYQKHTVWRLFDHIEEYVYESKLTDDANTLYLSDMTGRLGETFNLPIRMKNASSINAFLCDVHLPYGLEPVHDSEGNVSLVIDSFRKPSSTPIIAAKWNEETRIVKVVIFSTGSAFRGSLGPVVYIPTQVAYTMPPGRVPLVMTNIMLNTPKNATYTTTASIADIIVYPHLCGDINHDSRITIADLTTLNGFRFDQSVDYFCPTCADINADGCVDLYDYSPLTTLIINDK